MQRGIQHCTGVLALEVVTIPAVFVVLTALTGRQHVESKTTLLHIKLSDCGGCRTTPLSLPLCHCPLLCLRDAQSGGAHSSASMNTI